MSDSKKHDSIENGEIGGSGRADQLNGQRLQDDSKSSAVRSVATSIFSRDMLFEEGDGDPLLKQNDPEERLLQFLRALGLQVMGACRADERLRPLLKLNVLGGTAEDRLLDHLNQHFEASEVGILARCLCIPLVSIRVGKIMKEGSLLYPTATRGNLNLTLLPTSDLRISFIGDDGCAQILSTVCSMGQRSAVTIEEISADSSGRSFLLKVSDSKVFYFWCSEKSKLLGNELLSKMKDLLRKPPSLAVLTGISEARLSCFATHLHAYLIGSTVNPRQASSTPPSLDAALDLCELRESTLFTSTMPKSSRSQHNISNQVVNANLPYQGDVSPKSSSFEEGLPTCSSWITTVREFGKRGDIHLSTVESLPPFITVTAGASSTHGSGKSKNPEGSGSFPLTPSSLPDSLGKSVIPHFLTNGSECLQNDSSPYFPYYCWCPPFVPTSQYAVAPSQQQTLLESLSLPPLSSFLPAARSSGLLNPAASLDVSFPSLDFPAFLPDPLVRLPSSTSIPQHIRTFTPLMCDPIVHIPVIDVCSSGQGYLVSADSAVSTTIPPLHPKLVNQFGPEADSAVENSARETLRLLINGSSPATPQLMDILPAVLSSTEGKQSVLVTGSRGLYNGAVDGGAFTNGIATISFGESVLKRCSSQKELENRTEGLGGPVSSSLDNQGSSFSNFSNETTG